MPSPFPWVCELKLLMLPIEDAIAMCEMSFLLQRPVCGIIVGIAVCIYRLGELKLMAGRIMEMRQALKDGLEREGQSTFDSFAQIEADNVTFESEG